MDPTQDNATQADHIIHEDTHGDRQYVLHPEDNDLFVRTGHQVIADCRLGISIQVWFEELKSMGDEVEKWALERSDRIEACYAVPRGGCICLFFVLKASSFDFDLADELTVLNDKLGGSLNVGPIESYQIPSHEITTFVDPSAKQVYANAG